MPTPVQARTRVQIDPQECAHVCPRTHAYTRRQYAMILLQVAQHLLPTAYCLGYKQQADRPGQELQLLFRQKLLFHGRVYACMHICPHSVLPNLYLVYILSYTEPTQGLRLKAESPVTTLSPHHARNASELQGSNGTSQSSSAGSQAQPSSSSSSSSSGAWNSWKKKSRFS